MAFYATCSADAIGPTKREHGECVVERRTRQQQRGRRNDYGAPGSTRCIGVVISVYSRLVVPVKWWNFLAASVSGDRYPIAAKISCVVVDSNGVVGSFIDSALK